MIFPLALLTPRSTGIEYFDFWTVSNTAAYTYSMTVKGTLGEKLYIDWGDGIKEVFTFTGANQVITHAYAIGTYQQKWYCNKLALTALIAISQNLTGALPIALQGFYGITDLLIGSNSFNSDLGANNWLIEFAKWSSLKQFKIEANDFYGDLSGIGVFSALKYMQYFFIHDNDFTGDISAGLVQLTTWTAIRHFYIQDNNFTGDLSGIGVLSVWTLISRFYLYNNDFTGSIESWNTFSAWTSLQYFQIQNNGFTGYAYNLGQGSWDNIIISFIHNNSLTGLNDFMSIYFNNRAIYSATIKYVYTTGNNEYLTGIYQEPDLGTYTGDINDLTETQITNLSNGLDYDSSGENVVWSILEKVYILKTLETTSTSGVLRYRFIVTYDETENVLQIPNSGSLGLMGVPDWDDVNSDGLGDNWTQNGTNLIPSVITGNDFIGNAQRVEKSVTGTNFIITDTFNLVIDSTYKISFKYRAGGSTSVIGYVSVLDSSLNVLGNTAIDTNDSSAVVLQSITFTALAISNAIKLYINTYASIWVEFDEVEIIEV